MTESGAIENPFPVKAVSTYGGAAQAFAELSYMHAVEEVLVDYLRRHPDAGAAVALSGGHGTGKTYLLNWLTRRAKEIQSAGARVIYAKTDSPDLVDTYRSLLRNLTRRDLMDVVHTALLKQGLSRVQSAVATQSDGDVIDQTQSMEAAYAEKVLDPNELHLELRQKLKERSVASTISERIAFAIGLLEHAQYGEAAYDWLAGQSAVLPDETLKAPLFSSEGTEGGQAVVEALETLAALFMLAGTPFVILLDQVENFIPRENVAVASSVVKKLAEQLAAQGAMVVMAGTPAAWEHLPRDLWPRFQNRGTFPVGALSIDETTLLLEAYLPTDRRFAPEIIQLVNDLSGGNAREILQIAHQAWEARQGDLAALTEDAVREAAKASGSLDDRAQLAQQSLTEVAEERKLSLWRADEGDDSVRAWIMEAPSGRRAAVLVVVATDARAESRLANEVTSLARQYQASGEAHDIIAVTVGYSSKQVQSLLTGISRAIVFREHSFKNDLRKDLDTIISAQPPAPVPAAPAPDPQLESKLAYIEQAIADIQRAREETEKRAAEALAQSSQAFASTGHQQREARTKLQLREGLEQLSKALARAEIDKERALLRSLLIDNEAFVANADFDYLGNVYLDCLDLYAREQVYEHSDRLTGIRLDLLAAMRRALTSPRSELTNSVSFKAIAALLVGTLFAYFLYMSSETLGFSRERRFEGLPVTLLVSMVFAATIYFWLDLVGRPTFRFGRYRRAIESVRAALSSTKSGASGARAASRPPPEPGAP